MWKFHTRVVCNQTNFYWLQFRYQSIKALENLILIKATVIYLLVWLAGTESYSKRVKSTHRSTMLADALEGTSTMASLHSLTLAGHWLFCHLHASLLLLGLFMLLFGTQWLFRMEILIIIVDGLMLLTEMHLNRKIALHLAFGTFIHSHLPSCTQWKLSSQLVNIFGNWVRFLM